MVPNYRQIVLRHLPFLKKLDDQGTFPFYICDDGEDVMEGESRGTLDWPSMDKPLVTPAPVNGTVPNTHPRHSSRPPVASTASSADAMTRILNEDFGPNPLRFDYDIFSRSINTYGQRTSDPGSPSPVRSVRAFMLMCVDI
jgi:hypothetical protein